MEVVPRDMTELKRFVAIRKYLCLVSDVGRSVVNGVHVYLVLYLQ